MIDPDATSPLESAGRNERPAANGLSVHILPTSATMIGVCLTTLYISLLGTVGTRRKVVDKLMAVDALVFLVSALLSFMSMRSRRLGSGFRGVDGPCSANRCGAGEDGAAR